MPIRVPTKVFLTKGVGIHKQKLTSFEYALRDAGIAAFNLVTVSSIFPPGAKLVSREEGSKMLEGFKGGIVHCVMSKADTDEPNRLIVASNGLAIPKEDSVYGYISEHHACGQNQKEGGDYAEDLAVEMLGTTLGIEVDVNKDYDELTEQYKLSGKIIKTTSVSQAAVGRKGVWTTVITAVMFCEYK